MSVANLTTNNNLVIYAKEIQCTDCNTENVSFNDCDAQVAHINDLYLVDPPLAYADRLLFYNTATKQVSYNKGYFSQEVNVTFKSQYYLFQISGVVRFNIVGNCINVFIVFNSPYTYFQTVGNSGVWTTDNQPLAGIAPNDGAIYTNYIVNGTTYGYQQILIRVFNSGDIQLQNLSGSWPTVNGEQLNAFNTGFCYINPDV